MKANTLFHIHFIKNKFIAREKALGWQECFGLPHHFQCAKAAEEKKTTIKYMLQTTSHNELIFIFLGLCQSISNTIFCPSSKDGLVKKYKFKLYGTFFFPIF